MVTSTHRDRECDGHVLWHRWYICWDRRRILVPVSPPTCTRIKNTMLNGYSHNSTVYQITSMNGCGLEALTPFGSQHLDSAKITLERSSEQVQSVGQHITDRQECESPNSNVTNPLQNLDCIAASPQVDDRFNQRNVVIFGDSGVGKSSLINILAGHKIAKTSSSAIGCTFQSTHYKIPIHGKLYNIWDTAGLDEGTQGRVPAQLAEKNLTRLLRDLGGANGIDLLIYCVRGSSIKKSLSRNYTIFYSAICRKKVPIVVVVTGLENEPSDMAHWWAKGEKELARYKMRFDDYACVTTLDPHKTKGTLLEHRSTQSQEAVRNLVAHNCRHATARRADTTLIIKAAVSDLRSMIKSGWESQIASNIMIMSTDVPVFMPDIMGDWTRCSTRIRGRPFIFFRVSGTVGSGSIPKSMRGGPDLLIFVGRASSDNADKFQRFHSIYRGDICPIIIATVEPSKDGWDSVLLRLGIHANVVSLDPSVQSGKDLHTMIDELCLIRGAEKIRRGGIFSLFLRKTPQTCPPDDIVTPPSPLIGRSSSFAREGNAAENHTQGPGRRPSGNLSQHDGAAC